MGILHLQTRFILAGCLLVMTTVGSSLWSAWTFARLSAVVGDTLHESQETIDLSAALAGSLEREDDALLLALSGEGPRSRRELDAERQRGDDCYRRLLARVSDGDERERTLVQSLRQDIVNYRDAGSALIAQADRPGALESYHKQVNPLLRHAVAACGQIREENFRSMQQAGIRARDEANRATGFVAGVSLLAIVLATAVAFWLARSVVGPVQALTDSVDALRQGDFERRLPPFAPDELGRLASGFNRMAETLSEYRRSSLGELLAAKTTLEATLNALPDAVFVVAPDGALAALNPRAREVLRAKGAADAHRLADLPLSPEHLQAVETALAGRPHIPPRTDFAGAIPIVLAGRPHRFLLTAAPIPQLAPGRFGAVVVLDDVTEFARLDELRSELIGVASHELKTPLTTLRMNLLLLEEQADNLTARQREMLAAAEQGCEELGGTIDELLDVTRIEAGQLRLNLAPLDLRGLLAQVLQALQPRFEDSQVRIRLEPEGPPMLVRGDAARLRIVLANVLTNALKYAPSGSAILIRLASGPSSRPGETGMVQITVTDAGPGIPVEFRERVFEKFFRVEHQLGSNPNGVHGTGIGLYLCREIVKAHGGTIQCEPGDGGSGTRIALLLPPA